jgi:hypothetical protein
LLGLLDPHPNPLVTSTDLDLAPDPLGSFHHQAKKSEKP